MEEDRARTDAATIERLLSELEAEIERLEGLLQQPPRKTRQEPKIPHVA